ncbi:MAG: hypothetical protein RLP97_14310 [Coleofasciculus chthonoplastes F2-STO-03]
MIESFDTPYNDFGIIPSPVRLGLAFLAGSPTPYLSAGWCWDG